MEAVADWQMSARHGPTCTVVESRGELDMDTVPMLEDFLREIVDAGARYVVLDVAEVTFMDSSGLSLLVESLRRLRDAGGGLGLARVREPVRTVLVLSALDRVLPIYESVEDAEEDVPSARAGHPV